MDEKCILLTGAAGFIGSHCVVALGKAGYNVLAMENSTSKKNFALDQVNKILGYRVKTCSCNLLNYEEIASVFKLHKISTVIHLAASKGVTESSNSPIDCYRNNLVGAMNLLEAMKTFNVKNLIFSSTCAIYGNQIEMPVKEAAQSMELSNVYGRSKYFIEEILKDLSRADKDFKITVLRYFNPVGAHSSEWLGEDPNGKQISFLTLLGQAALDGRDLSIFGSANVRDFVHVMDVAEAHINCIEKMNEFTSFKVFNLGSGFGLTLLELIKTFEAVNDVKISYEIKTRRAREIEAIVADTKLSEEELEWRARRSVEEMCMHCWKWTKYHSKCLK